MKRPPSEDALPRVRQARRHATAPEARLWQALRARQLDGAKFRRQVWIGPFIADFLCAAANLVVEVDGESHAKQIDDDRRRTEWLEREGFRVLRVSNAEVMDNLEGVLTAIAVALSLPSHPAGRAGPSLSPSGRGKLEAA